MRVVISVRDQVMARFGNQLTALGAGKANLALRRAMNHTGAKAKTQVSRALTTQTGLPRKTIVRAVRVLNASVANLSFALETKGGDISLKYFKARETRQGVSAAPWNKRKVYPSTFTKGGRFPKRKALRKGKGHVFARAGAGRLPIKKQKSGLYIPREMVQGQTKDAWDRLIVADLLPRVRHEVARMLPK
ncbi:MAG: hypothetical protein Q8M31_21715 [Beijerinckiaceae bacterium]|nr:hypothetical protein [Beijerinckiaceae bacterium]